MINIITLIKITNELYIYIIKLKDMNLMIENKVWANWEILIFMNLLYDNYNCFYDFSYQNKITIMHIFLIKNQ